MSGSNNDFNSDLEAILAEFASYSSNISGTPDAPQEGAKNASKADAPADSGAEVAPKAGAPMKDGGAEYYVDVSRLEDYLTHRKDAQDAKKSAPPKRAEDFSPEFTPSGRAYRRPEAWAVPGAGGKRGRQGAAFDPDKFLTDSEKKKAQAIQKKAEAKQARLDAQKSALRQKDKDAVAAQEHQREVRERAQSPVKTLIAAVFGVLTLLALCWVGVNIHPDSGTATAAKVQNNLNLTSKLDVYINNAASDALSDLTYIKKIYKIAETDTVAPKPDANAFGTTTDPAVVQAVIADAEELLDGQQTVWQPDLPFYPGTEMYYYRDATILVIVWKEIIEERCATLAEVKIADGSQFRRRLTEDTYGSSVQLYATELAAASNAVVAANADFYAFRQIGLTVYQRQLFRNDAAKLDTCFVTADGDMLFARAGELVDDASVNQYIADNDVVFSLSFGPVLIDNGVVQECSGYPIGEMDLEYSRSGIGMTGDKHYLLMTVNHTDGRPRAKVNEFARFMASKGCIKAYNLDGGQTSEIVMLDQPVNHVDFGYERTVSDIIYFATAIPSSEVTG